MAFQKINPTGKMYTWVQELERSQQLLLASKAEPGGAKSHAVTFLFCTLCKEVLVPSLHSTNKCEHICQEYQDFPGD